MTVDTSPDDLRVPDYIARAIMTADQWDQVDEVIYPAGKWLRENLPVGRGYAPGYDPVWIVSRHKDIRDILKDVDTFHSADQNFMLVTQEGDGYLRGMLGGTTSPIDNLTPMDAPVHMDHRNAQAIAFTVESIKKYEDNFRLHARASVDNFLSTGGQCDAVASLTHHYPLRVIMEMIDVPESDFPLMERLTQETFGGDDPDIVQNKDASLEVSPETAARLWQEAVAGFYDYFDSIVQDRRARPRDDLATAIVLGRLGNGELMTPKRQNHMLASLAIAGHDTVNAALAGGILGLARHPDQLALIRADPSLIPGLVDESTRYGTPTKHFMRSASRDVEFRGVPIKKGDRVMVLLFSGNMDESVFPDAEAFDVTRRPNPHLSYGFGPHICLGMHIAKIEMRILFEELIPRVKTLELAGQFRRKRANFVTSIKTLPVRFSAA